MKKAADATPNPLLVAVRLQRHWTQQEVAERLGMTVVNVSRWERGLSTPGAYFRYSLYTLYDKSARELGLEVDTEQDGKLCQLAANEQAPVTTRPWHVPFPRNPLFTGREAALEQLHQILLDGSSTPSLPLVLSGLGGIGKTQTVLEYAYRYRAAYSAVLWVSGERHDRLLADFVALAYTLRLVESEECEQVWIVGRVQQWLSEHADWLLILDNVDDLPLVQEFVPNSHSGHVLLTTRTQITGVLAQCVELYQMTQNEGVLFLLRRAKRISAKCHLEECPEQQRVAAQEIVHLMEGLPLALDQAGAYLEETNCEVSTYLRHFHSRRLCLLQRRGEPVVQHPDSVSSTFALSLEQIERVNPVAADLLRLCAFLHPDAIPEEILLAALSDITTVQQDTTFIFDAAIKDLRRFSLVQRRPENRLLMIHRLVQTVLKESLDEAAQQLWATRVVTAVYSALLSEVADSWSLRDRYLAHALTCASLITQWNMQFPAAAGLLHRTGALLAEQGNYSQAEQLLHSALVIYEQTLGIEHPNIAEIVNDLALSLHQQGKDAQAEILYKKALLLWEKLLGAEDPDLAHGLNNLAFLYHEQGRYTLAESLYQRSLRIREQVLGPDSSMVAESLNNLAALYRDVGMFSQAKRLYQRAIDIREQKLGTEHPLVAQSLNGLARLYYEQGCYVQAKRLYQRALDIREQKLGAEHPRVALCLNNLAELYLAEGQTAQAQPLVQRSLAIRERTLGQEHPDFAQSLNTLAELYLANGRLPQAENACQRALAIYKKARGKDHPRMVRILNTLAALYRQQGKCALAESYLQQALAISTPVMGPEHSTIPIS